MMDPRAFITMVGGSILGAPVVGRWAITVADAGTREVRVPAGSYPSAASDFHAIWVGEVRQAMSPAAIHFGTPNGRSREGDILKVGFPERVPDVGRHVGRHAHVRRHVRTDLREPGVPVRGHRRCHGMRDGEACHDKPVAPRQRSTAL